MKRVLLFALFFGEVAAVASSPGACPRRRLWAEPGPRVLQAVEPTGRRVVIEQEVVHVSGPLPAIAARASRRSLARPVPIAEGPIPRALTSRVPAQMINPLAPLEYGSGWSFLTFTERDPYRTDNANKIHLQPDGLRLLTLRPLW